MNTSCPHCGSQNLQSVMAVVAGGNWSGESIGGAVGIVSGGGLGFGLGTASHSGATGIARTLAPPPQPIAVPLGLFVTVGILLLLVGGGLGTAAYFLDSPFWVTAWSAGASAIAASGIILAGFKK